VREIKTANTTVKINRHIKFALHLSTYVPLSIDVTVAICFRPNSLLKYRNFKQSAVCQTYVATESLTLETFVLSNLYVKFIIGLPKDG
jgi:hypothetical protein